MIFQVIFTVIFLAILYKGFEIISNSKNDPQTKTNIILVILSFICLSVLLNEGRISHVISFPNEENHSHNLEYTLFYQPN